MTSAVCAATVLVILSSVLAPTQGWFSNEYFCQSRGTECQIEELVLETDAAIGDARFGPIKGSLLVESGRIPHVTRALLKKWPDVNDLTLDRLGVQSLFVGPKLMHLSAVGNAIESLVVDNDDNGTSFGLRTLQLSNNRLTALTVVSRFVQLRVLNLDHNQLTTLDLGVFGKLAELRVLSVAHNQLTTVVLAPQSAPLQLDKLRSLSFAGNDLIALDMQHWEFASLADLNLTANGLNWVEGKLDQFPALAHVEVARNRWNCDWLLVQNLYAMEVPDQRFTLDQDPAGRCEEEKLTRMGRHCCTSEKVAPGAMDVYDSKWSEIGALSKNITNLNRTLLESANATVRLIEAHHNTLSGRLEDLLERQNRTDTALKSLAVTVDELKDDDVSRLESRMRDQIEQVRDAINERWNGTQLADANTTLGSSWHQTSVAHETALKELRGLLQQSTQQMQLYTDKAYKQQAVLERQSKDMDSIRELLDRAVAQSSTLQARVTEKLERKVEALLEFLAQISEDNGESNTDFL
ncbi:uncharacterized protein LOC131215011 [Anopheles bellator]|uniref:uncharacterized protein LOC131215011 n=1 Tax=Anopheles bellator TaxID=139047 RepID=UPI00264A2D27|nr:uncharacterized protein LOC131215011 [Anopheles bellator]